MKKLRTLKIGRHIALLLILVISITYVNVWFYESFRIQAEEVNEYVNNQMTGRISDYYEEINALVVGTVSDTEVLQLQSFSDKNEVYRSEMAINIVNELRTNDNKSPAIKKTYIYIADIDLILCSSGIVDSETFYNVEAKKYFDSYESWMTYITTENGKKNFLTNDKNIMFSFPLSRMRGLTNKRSIIIGAIADKKDVFIKTPHIDWINKCNIYVYNRNGEINLCEENIKIENVPSKPTYAEVQNLSSEYDVLPYEVSVNDTTYHMFVVFEKNLNMKNVEKVQAVSIATTIISFLLVFYYFYDLYKKKYKPIKAISTLLEININKIDYTLIEKPIENILEKNQLLNNMLERNNSNLKLIILKRLLTGDLSKEFMKDLENLGIKFTKEGCFVVAIHL